MELEDEKITDVRKRRSSVFHRRSILFTGENNVSEGSKSLVVFRLCLHILSAFCTFMFTIPNINIFTLFFVDY